MRRPLQTAIAVSAGDTVNLELDYDPAVFTAEGVELFARYLSVLINAAAEVPQTAVADLPLLDANLRQFVLRELNDTDERLLDARPLTEIFAERCRQAPAACAVECDERQLTYAELARHSARLARVLQDRGVGPEVVVGISSEPTPETTVGHNGHLLAGGAFLPLDLKYPAERLRFMIEDAKVRLILVGAGSHSNLPEGAAELLRIDIA